MNMYERYAIKDVWFGRKNKPILKHALKGTIKDLETDEIYEPMSFGRPTHISVIVKENLRPNQIYKSKLMQDCLKLMEQANWNKETFTNLWNIVYGNGIITREEVLQVAHEIKMQKHNESLKEEIASKLHEETTMNF